MAKHDILFGTKNPTKFQDIEVITRTLPIRLLSPSHLGVELNVAEVGSLPEENARIKAEAYCRAARMTTLGLDSGLLIDGLPEEEQPGVHVRRVNGVTLDDQAMLEYYARLIHRLGGYASGRWVTSLVLVMLDGRANSITISHETQFVDQACHIRTPGNPLNALQINPTTGRHRSQEPPDSFQRQVHRFFADSLRMFDEVGSGQ